MSFSEYQHYKVSELEKIFKINVKNNALLFTGIESSAYDYAAFQRDIKKRSSRLRISMFDNEATRRHLLVSPILQKAADIYNLGVFFEPPVCIKAEDTPDLPHQLNGQYDGALSLDEIDFIFPIIAVVEVKQSHLSDGLGQCVAEMYATLKQFKQPKVYGIITDGDVWEFLLLEKAVLSIDEDNYYMGYIGEIVDRIGFIAKTFSKK